MASTTESIRGRTIDVMRGAAALAFGLVGIHCGGPGAPQDVSAAEESITNGNVISAESSTWVFIRWPVGNLYAKCSGALVTNRSVVTAKHCFEGHNGEPVEIAMGSQTAVATSIALHPDHPDVAVVRMNRAFWVSGSRGGYRRPFLQSGEPATPKLVCYGYGRHIPGQTQDPFPGTLRYAILPASEIIPSSADVFTYRNEDGQLQDFGDSGGGCVMHMSHLHLKETELVSIQSFCSSDTCTSHHSGFFGAWAEPRLSTCTHDLCDQGVPLTATCDPCAATVCAADPFCCGQWWDGICVSEAQTQCVQGQATSCN
jgi:hypothetical protein